MEKIQIIGVRKGAWTKEEDTLLRKCVENYGEGKWHLVPLRAGLNRCRKSCRLRWLNYLSPNIKRGVFDEDEIDLIVRLHNLLGNRWSIIAGRVPGRTANDIKNFWKTYSDHKKSSAAAAAGKSSAGIKTTTQIDNIIKPIPRTFSKLIRAVSDYCPNDENHRNKNPSHSLMLPESGQINDWTINIDENNNNNNLKNKETFLSSQEEDDEKINECIRWWGDLLEITDQNEQGNSSSEMFSDHLFTDEHTMLFPELDGHGNNCAYYDEFSDLSLDLHDWELRALSIINNDI